MTPMTEEPAQEPVVRQSRLSALMLAWRASSPAQRHMLRLVTLLTILALAVDAVVVGLARHLLREGLNAPAWLAFNVPAERALHVTLWLYAHVLTMVGAFAAFGLAWALGAVSLTWSIVWAAQGEWWRTLSTYCLAAMQVGVILLGGGMILGACWAADSWGRFWSWDPKEIWTLITLLFYLLAVHARHAAWISDFGLAVAAVLCFGCAIMAWFGVNQILRAGQHTYGFGSGNGLWLLWAGLANLALVLHAGARYALGKRPATQPPAV